MITYFGEKASFCDRVARRSFLKAGVLGLGGLTLADILRLRSNADSTQLGNTPKPKTSVIFLEMAGGLSQFESYDPKPDAPREYRGPFGTIQTSVPGIVFSELMVEQSKILDKLAIVRSIHHDRNSHDPSSHLSQTGYYKTGKKGGPSQMPCFGSAIAKIRGPNHRSLPAYVAVPSMMRNGGAAHLGKGYNPFETSGDPNKKDFRVKNLSLVKGLKIERVDDRRALLKSLDAQKRLRDLEGASDAFDQFTHQAFDLVTGPRARDAFDIQQEHDSLRDAYGRNSVGQSMLLARRLVEMGVTCVTVRVTGWDNHSNLARAFHSRAPRYDQGIAALIRDIYDRGLDKDVLVVAIGEFGRTPRFNPGAGRDHWGALMSIALAGGGLQTGVLGSSNARGEVPKETPYRPENVLATIYRHLGINPATTFNDFAGRPRYLLEERGLIRELI